MTTAPAPPPGWGPVPPPSGTRLKFILWDKAKGDRADDPRLHQMIRERSLSDPVGVGREMAETSLRRKEKGQESWLIFQNFGRTRTDDLERLRPGWADTEEVWAADWKWARHEEDADTHAIAFWYAWTVECLGSYKSNGGVAPSGFPMDVELAPSNWREPWMRSSLYEYVTKVYGPDCMVSNWKGGWTAWGDVLYGSDIEEEMAKIAETRGRHPRSWWRSGSELVQNPWIRLPGCWRRNEGNWQTGGQTLDLLYACALEGITTFLVWWDSTVQSVSDGIDQLLNAADVVEKQVS